MGALRKASCSSHGSYGSSTRDAGRAVRAVAAVCPGGELFQPHARGPGRGDRGARAGATHRRRHRQGRALSVLAWALWSLDRVIEARQAAVDAVGLLEDAGDPGDLARAVAAHIRMEATAFDSVAAIEAAPRALELAARAGLEEVRIDVMSASGSPAGISAIRRPRARSRRSSTQPARPVFRSRRSGPTSTASPSREMHATMRRWMTSPDRRCHCSRSPRRRFLMITPRSWSLAAS